MEEIINRLSYAAATYSFEGRNYPNCIVFREDLENLINKYKEQKRDIRDIHILLAKYSQKNEEQEKIIELMAKEIEVNTSDDGVNLRPATLKEKIDYFKKKARTSNDYSKSR